MAEDPWVTMVSEELMLSVPQVEALVDTAFAGQATVALADVIAAGAHAREPAHFRGADDSDRSESRPPRGFWFWNSNR